MLSKFYKNSNRIADKERLYLFISVFFLVAIRFLYFGFKYFPQLDDYIQHHNYAPQGSFFYLVERLGLLAARPLAGILDITLWSWLWPCSIVGVLILSAMYSAAAVNFYKIFNKLLSTSRFFIIVFALLPLGMEGTYWMSASTRIIPGVFFASISAWYFVRYLERKRIKYALTAVICQFITFCFYEQTAVLSCALNVVIAVLYLKNGNVRWRLSLCCIPCAAAYFLLTSLAGDSPLYSGRGSILLPNTPYYFDNFLPNLFSQFKSAFLGGGYYTFVYGFIRGVMRVLKDGAWFYCLLVLCGVLAFGYLSARIEHKKEKGNYIASVLVGVILILAPLAPFFIIENPWFSFRGTVPSFVGIAILCDAFVRIVFGNRKKAIAAMSSVFAFIFCICSVSELADYRSTYLADMKVVSKIATVTSEIKEDFPDKSKVAVFNVDAQYVTELNSNYHEHIHGVTESDWALTGAVQCYNDNPFEGITYVPFSLKDAYLYKHWNYASKNLASMDAVYVYDYERDTIEKLTVNAYDSTFELYYPNGEKYITVFEQDNCAIFVEE